MELTPSILKAYSEHSRSFLNNRYVYPVLSRRSKGISIGINLNPDKVCNFNCIYCQVDRHLSTGETPLVEIAVIIQELREILESIKNGIFYSTSKFKEIPKARLTLRDIAFSGDGEPSLFPQILELTQRVIALKNSFGFSDIKVIMITNATGLSRAETGKALDLLDADQGEIWAKLDAGTASYFHQVCRTSIGFNKILNNILMVSQKRPIVIQSCFMKINGKGPTKEEIEAYRQYLISIKEKKGNLKLVQIYTVARKPAEEYVQPLEVDELDLIIETVRSQSGLMVEAFYHA